MRKTTVVTVVAAVTIAVIILIGSTWAWYCSKEWTAWHDFAEEFIQPDGRVIDYLDRDRSTSEGQAYALFFALVADDEPRFKRLLRWAQDNLAQGDLHSNLPAWLWGHRKDGSWGVLDSNPASDADLWLAYTLLEASRLWRRDDYLNLADALLQQIKAREIQTLPGLGPMLLPAPDGFHSPGKAWRLNPSYLPGFVLARLAEHDPAGPWAGVRRTANLLLQRAAPLGLAPDWFIYTPDGKVAPDPKTGALGSYDAIRVYLWAGLDNLQSKDSMNSITGMAKLIDKLQAVPERVNTQTGESHGQAPAGFAGALLPYIYHLGDKKMQTNLSAQIKGGATGKNTGHNYYDHVLILFGSGWLNNYYHIAKHGHLAPRWSGACCGMVH